MNNKPWATGMQQWQKEEQKHMENNAMKDKGVSNSSALQQPMHNERIYHVANQE